MTDHVAEIERAKYVKTWADPVYRLACHGLKLWRERAELFPPDVRSALDIGCGTGRLLQHWIAIGLDAWGYDIAENCLDSDVALVAAHRVRYGALWDMDWGERTFDLGVCTDVMEHIPEELVPAVVERIGACCRFVVFKIAHSPNHLGEEILHLTLRPHEWWVDRMPGSRFVGTEMRSGFQDSIITWRPR